MMWRVQIPVQESLAKNGMPMHCCLWITAHNEEMINGRLQAEGPAVCHEK